MGQAPAPSAATPSGAGAAQAGQANAPALEKLKEVQQHLQRYKELSAQGKWAEAGKELDQIQQLVNKTGP
jgi:septation ring formation regulator EzrA